MATKIIKAWIDGAIQEIEVDDILSPKQNPSYEERLDSLEETDIESDKRLDKLEDKPIISKGNFLVGDGTTELKEIEPSEVLTRINGANIALVTEEEFGALTNDTVNANTLYLVNDGVDEEYYTKTEIDERVEEIDTSIASAVNEAKSYSDTNLETAEMYTDEQVATKSQVQMIDTNEVESLIRNLATLKIHKLSKSKYEEELAKGNIDENALYLTPEEEIDLSPYATVEQLNTKADTEHIHKISDVINLQSTLDGNLTKAKSYTDTKVANLASTSTVDSKINNHNTSASAHDDIRVLIADISTKLNNFLDIDDATSDQLSEVLTLIENNKGTLESLTASKINVSDIINNLTTVSTSKVLSANQGVILKNLIDALQTKIDSKVDSNHNHDEKYDSLGSANTALETANTYTDNVVSQKTQVQMISINETENLIRNLSTLKIHKLSQSKYDEELANDNIDENALYLTPEEECYTKSEIDEKISMLNSLILEVKSYIDTKCVSVLKEAQMYTDNAVSQKTEVQTITWEEND